MPKRPDNTEPCGAIVRLPKPGASGMRVRETYCRRCQKKGSFSYEEDPKNLENWKQVLREIRKDCEDSGKSGPRIQNY